MTPAPTPSTEEQAARGLMEWGRATYGEFIVAMWSPTISDINAAARANMTWTYAQWQRHVGHAQLRYVYAVLDRHGFATDPQLRSRRAGALTASLEQATRGLLEWAQETYGSRPDWDIANWLPQKRDIEAASRANRTWSYTMWLARSGGNGIAGVHNAIQVWHPVTKRVRYSVRVPRFASLAEAAEGLRDWGITTYGHQPDWSIETWRPTRDDFARASKMRMTWSLDTWKARTGHRGMHAIQAALNEHGFNIAIGRFANINEAAAGLETWVLQHRGPIATWTPTRFDIDLAAHNRCTWSYRTWVTKTGDLGMSGVRAALADYGFGSNDSLSRNAFSNEITDI